MAFTSCLVQARMKQMDIPQVLEGEITHDEFDASRGGISSATRQIFSDTKDRIVSTKSFKAAVAADIGIPLACLLIGILGFTGVLPPPIGVGFLELGLGLGAANAMSFYSLNQGIKTLLPAPAPAPEPIVTS